MTINVRELRERRNHLAKQARDLMDSTKDKLWTVENQNAYDAFTGEIIAVDQQLTNLQRLADLEAEKQFDIENAQRIDPRGVDPLSERGIFNSWARNGDRGLSPEQIQRIANTMSTTTTTEGGYTVQSEVAKEVIDSLKAFGGMRNVSEVIVTAQGNPLSYPTSDGTAEVGELLAENVTATALDPSFGTVALNAFKYSSKIIAVPFELLQDSSVDIEAFVRGRLVTRLGRITNQHFTTGTGSGQPRGVVVGSSVGKTGTTGQTLTIIYADIVDLIDSVDAAYQASGRCRFMMSQSMRKVVRKVVDGSSRPLWTPSYEAGIVGGFVDTLAGFPVEINNDMAAPGASAKTLLFGDFSTYKIRDVMQVSMFRFTDSAYTKLGQVGFLAWMRTGGNLVDTAAVKHYAHSAT